jgi:hypothetical protein
MNPNGKGVVVTRDLHLRPLLTLERTKGLQLPQTPAQTHEGSLRLEDTSKPTLTQPINYYGYSSYYDYNSYSTYDNGGRTCEDDFNFFSWLAEFFGWLASLFTSMS